jgi:predicted RNA-binding protein YlxR (DUF448 family)
MVRLVKTQAGNVEVDIPGEKEGRGAYLCRDKACWDKALKSNQLEHAFKGKISQEDKERMIETAKELFKESTSAQG